MLALIKSQQDYIAFLLIACGLGGIINLIAAIATFVDNKTPAYLVWVLLAVAFLIGLALGGWKLVSVPVTANG